MTDKRLNNLLEQVRNNRRGGAPRESWVSANRDILMMQLRNTTDQVAKPDTLASVRHFFGIFVPAESVYAMARATATFVLVVGTVLGGGVASATFYADTVPGEGLYRVKTAVETVELILAPNDEYRTRLHAEFADHRISEVARLSEGAPNGYRYIPEVLTSFNQEVKALGSGLAAGSDANVELAKSLERRMTSYQTTLRKALAVLPPSYRAEINDAKTQVSGVGIKAMAVIMENYRQGSESTTGTVVASKLDDHIKQVESKLDTAETEAPEAATKTAQAKTAISEAKTLMDEGNYEAAFSKIVEVADLTQGVAGLEELSTPEEPATPETPTVETPSEPPTEEQPVVDSEE